MDLDMVPDITMRGQADPHGRTITARPPTVGRLAARIHELAGRPADWWPLVTFDPAAPVRVRLDADDVELWLTTWPPGHRTDLHDHEGVTTVSTVIAGELAEVTVNPHGVSERPLRANRIRVHGGAQLHELTNPGPAYAITLHARPR